MKSSLREKTYKSPLPKKKKKKKKKSYAILRKSMS